MQAEDPILLDDVSREIANLIPGITEVSIRKDVLQEEYAVWATMQDGSSFPARLLSDGTLRMLALVVLKNDPHYQGVLCLEEPEIGVHPAALQGVASLLTGLATDLSDPAAPGESLRQVLVNTHSPVLVRELRKASAGRADIVFAYTVRHLPGQNRTPYQVTRMVPIAGEGQARSGLDSAAAEQAFTLKQVTDYLNSTDTRAATPVFPDGEASGKEG